MSTVSMEPLLHHSVRESVRCAPKSVTFKPSSLSCSTNRKLVFHARSFCNFRPSNNVHALRASTTTDTGLAETVESTDVFFKETFPLKRMETVRILSPNISVSFCFVCTVSVRFREIVTKKTDLFGCGGNENWVYIFLVFLSVKETVIYSFGF